jgi:dienelactone hydrolase
MPLKMMVKLLALALLTIATPSALATQARSLPIDVLQRRAPASAVQFREERLSFLLSTGTAITAHLMLPDTYGVTQSDVRHPVLLVFGGFEEAGHVLDLIHPSVPIIVASFDYPFEAPRKFEFPGSLRFAPQAKQAVHETIEGIEVLCRELRKRKDVDPDRITLVGASFGAPFALTAAAHDPEISGVVLVHGFGDVPNTIEHVALRSWQPRIGFLARPLAWVLSRLGWWYLKAPVPEREARLLEPSQRVLMITAEDDSFVPAESSDALWQALQNSLAQRERILMPGDHLQPGSKALLHKISEIVTSWMEKVSLR